MDAREAMREMKGEYYDGGHEVRGDPTFFVPKWLFDEIIEQGYEKWPIEFQILNQDKADGDVIHMTFDVSDKKTVTITRTVDKPTILIMDESRRLG